MEFPHHDIKIVSTAKQNKTIKSAVSDFYKRCWYLESPKQTRPYP